MTVTRKGKAGELTTRRGGGGKGRTWESQQQGQVGKDAKKAMTPRAGYAPGPLKTYGQNVIREGERKMSISASKDREDPGGSKYWSHSRSTRPTK